ncbi:kinase-like protein [Atractiella rhizophila]|nr:kinase-like protein [Atractiella rhizophila]
MSIIKSFLHSSTHNGSGATTPDMLTPKASDANRNPFDFIPPSPTTASSSRKNSIFTPSFLSSSTVATPTAGIVGTKGIPTTAISRGEPEFDLKLDPSRRRKESGPEKGQRGKLFVKLVSARNLGVPAEGGENVAPPRRPYVVVTFDQNEFISRTPIGEGVPEVSTVAGRKDSAIGRGGVNPSGLAKSLEAYKRQMGAMMSNGASGDSSPASVAATLPAEAVDTSDDDMEGMVHPTSNPVWKHEVIFDVVSDQSLLTFSLYDRVRSRSPSPDSSSSDKSGASTAVPSPTVISATERFLGHFQFRPRLRHGSFFADWFPLRSREDAELVPGEVKVEIRFEKSETRKLQATDFAFLKMIGRGTFGRVFQVRKKDTHRIYAMKVLSKKEIIAKKEVAHTIGERKILQRSSECPFLLGLKFSFQSETELFLVMDYKSGGELFHHLQKEGRFTEDRARFYTAEIVLAFEHLHKYDIVYRDLKPENILLDATGHIVLCDFGLSKPDLPPDALTNTFCGTTEYLAPEVLLDDHGYSKLVDFWSLGVLLFEMCCGWSPFYAEDTQSMYKNICFGKIKFPRGVIGDDGKQFVKGLLNRNPKHRLGSKNDAQELKEHAFFTSIDWIALSQLRITPPFKPNVSSDESVDNFDREFTEADVSREAPESAFRDKEGWEIKKRESREIAPDEFRGFSFVGESVGDDSPWLEDVGKKMENF